jgi:hypothetical protein
VSEQKAHSAGLFDLRLIIAMLFAVYGVVLIVVGAWFTDETELAKAGDININLWSGVGMAILAALFAVWAKLRPVVVPPDEAKASDVDVDATGH